MQLHQSRSLLLPGVLIMITLAMTSAFLHTTPPATSIGALRQEKGRQVGGGSTKSRRSRVFPSLPSGVTPRRPSKMLLAGAGAGAGAGDLLSPVGAIVSSAIVHAHAHLLSGPGVGTGLLLLAEESDKPGNIYGKIALGGVAIAFSSVFGAYIIATLVANMSTEDLMKAHTVYVAVWIIVPFSRLFQNTKKLNRDLAGGEEYEELERERERSQVRLAALAQQMEDAKDPARSLGLAPDGVREKKLEELTARVSTDIASIDDEYSD